VVRAGGCVDDELQDSTARATSSCCQRGNERHGEVQIWERKRDMQGEREQRERLGFG
jgi:hypothetical protein